MEPIMVLEIVAEEDHTSTLLADLSRRRANILHISHRHDMRVSGNERCGRRKKVISRWRRNGRICRKRRYEGEGFTLESYI